MICNFLIVALIDGLIFATIKASLIDAVEMSDAAVDKRAIRRQKIADYLNRNDCIMNGDVRRLCDVSTATANRILKELVAEGELVRCRASGHWAYRKK